MKSSSFFLQIFGLTILTALALWGLHQLPVFREAKLFSWISLAFFFVVSIGIYFLGKRAAQSSNKNAFVLLIMGFTFGKMILSLLLVVVYAIQYQPQTRYFVIPFFFVYLVYTIFETATLLKLARIKPGDHGR